MGTWVHWVLYKIPADATSLPEGLPREKTLKTPAGAVQGVNSFGKDNLGYRGPMPPPGHGTHHYHFKVYALDKPVSAPPGVDKKALAGRDSRPRAGPRRTGGNVSEVIGRNPKSECRNPEQIQSRKFKSSEQAFGIFPFRISNLFRISCFGFRISTNGVILCPTSAGIAARIPTIFGSLGRMPCRHCKRRPRNSPGS